MVQRRIKKSEVIEHNKDKVAQELLDIATANVMDILQVENKKVSLRDLKDIPEAAIKAIKTIVNNHVAFAISLTQTTMKSGTASLKPINKIKTRNPIAQR